MTKKNKKILIIALIAIFVLAILILFVLIPIRKKIQAPTRENSAVQRTNNTNSGNQNNNTDYQSIIKDSEKAIQENPKDPENYVSKSEAEYSSGNKEEAIETIEEGLKQDPENELLKSRLDVIQNSPSNNGDLDYSRE